jgi:glycosyltransferase involved in cell wall biosynthesis
MDQTVIKKTPRVSIVMPVYNCEDFLAEAIESMLNQTFADYEFIIINDGSKDKSLDIMKRYQKKDKRIKLISRPNKGLAPTLNEGLAKATGEYIARMDGDDISLPDRLQIEVDYLDAHPEVGLVGTNYIIIDPNGKTLDQTDVFTHADDLRVAMVTCNQYGHGSVMMRSNIFKRIKPYDPSIYVEDYDLFVRISHKYKVVNLQEPQYLWRRTFTSYTFNDTQKSTDKAAFVRDREFKYLLKHRREYKIFSSFHPGQDKRAYRQHLKYLLKAKPDLSAWEYHGI